MVCIVLKNMGENLRKIAMHITNEFVSQAVDQNFHEARQLGATLTSFTFCSVIH